MLRLKVKEKIILYTEGIYTTQDEKSNWRVRPIGHNDHLPIKLFFFRSDVVKYWQYFQECILGFP